VEQCNIQIIIIHFLYKYIFRQTDGSYLDAPRIHFAGQFRADINSRNNFPCNFDPDNPLYKPHEWNSKGTNDWEFINTIVTAVVEENGKDIPNSPLLGEKIFSNKNRPFAKIVDIDVDFQVSSLYGLEFGLTYDNETLFVGKWSTSVIVHDMWIKMKCGHIINKSGGRGYCILSTQSTSRITDLAWSQSDVINDLKAATKRQGATGDLSVSITLDVFSAHTSTIGRVYGTIGAAMANEPLNVGGERKMEPVDPGSLNFPTDHPCYGVDEDSQKPWTYGAPFKIDLTRNVLIADLGNALPRQQSSDPMDLGTLYFGFLVNGVVQPFGEAIPYTDSTSIMWKQSGIIEQPIGPDIVSNLQNSKLVIFTGSTTTTAGGNTYPIKEIFPSMQSNEMVSLLLLELEYFVRPMDYYIDRLEYSNDNEGYPIKNTSDITLFVTQFGQPVSNTNVTLIHSYNQAGQPVLPHAAVSPTDSTKTTDNNGHVTFTLVVNKPIPEARYYVYDTCSDYAKVRESGKPPVVRREINSELFSRTNIKSEYSLPIDGQLYNFYYCVGKECTLPNDGGFFLFKALISVLAFSTVTYKEPYTWVDHVQPIFRQVHNLHYIMRTILDLSNFTEVTLPHNIELLKKVLNKKINDPNFMPTTRDLSPTKRKMILAWLDNPRYSKLQKKPDSSNESICNTSSLLPKMRRPNFSHFCPPRCLLKNIPFDTDPETQDSYFHKIIKDQNISRLVQDAHHPPRALFGLGFEKENIGISKILEDNGYRPSCNINNLREQLQNAVLLEFSTLPLYLTSMYSIVENCNTDAYQTIREIAIQEMLHFVQAANILIAVGGEVIIDDPNYVPSYPSTCGLPGGVLPGLDVSLEKFNLRHVYDTMMVIETPISTLVAQSRPDPEITLYTMGQLYKEISLCTHILGDSIFDPTTAEHQVQWPWTEPDSVGTVHIITDGESARNGIDQIIEQGEDLLNPNHIVTGQYSHFYRFEEIVCQRRLIQTEEGGYAYAGAPITYDPAGVYPMRDNPGGDTIVPDTKCYTEAKVFHHIYHSFLHTLQETFNGEPNKIHQSVELMEALQVHAKKCMWTPYGEANTCGPVWNYDWE